METKDAARALITNITERMPGKLVVHLLRDAR